MRLLSSPRSASFLLLLLAAAANGQDATLSGVRASSPGSVATTHTHPPTAQTSVGKASKPGPTQTESGIAGEPLTIEFGPGKPVAIGDILPQAEEAQAKLREIQARSVRSPEIATVEQSLPQLARRIQDSFDETMRRVRESQSAQYLHETRVSWEQRRQLLESWNSAVGKQIAGLGESQQNLHEIAEDWTGALKSAQAVELREALLQRIEEVVASASQVDARVRTSLDFLLNLQLQIADQRQRVDEVLAAIALSDEALRERIFVVDSPPLWRLSRSQMAQFSIREQFSRSKTAASRVGEFVHIKRDELLVFLIFSAALLFLLVRLRTLRRDALGKAEEVVSETDFIERPIAFGSFLSLLLFGFFFPRSPAELLRLVQFLLVLPTSRLLSGIFKKNLHRPLFVLAGLYALDLLNRQATEGTLFRRLLVLLTSLIAAVWLASALRKGASACEYIKEKGWHAVFFFAWMSQIVLSLAFVLNLFGNVSLSDFLAVGALQGMYSGVVVYTAVLLFQALASEMVQTTWARRLRVVRLYRDLLLARISSGLRLLGWLVWAAAALSSFEIFRPALHGAREIVDYKWQLGAISISLSDILLFFLVLVGSNLVARVIRFFLEEELFPRTALSAGVASASSRLIHYFLVTVGFFLALGASGLELGRLTLLTGAFGVGLGFGLQNLVNNFVSGLILSLERPMQVGDVIEVEKLMGTVSKIGIRSSTVRTYDGAEVIVPNSELITKSFVNWSLTDRLRRNELCVGVAYGSDVDRVLALLKEVVVKTPEVLDVPPPQVLFEDFGDSSLHFLVRYWSRLEVVPQVRSDVHQGVIRAFRESHIEIPFPQRDVHVVPKESGSKTPLPSKEKE